jgi:hypothetical protein
MDGLFIDDRSGDRKYFTIIPNLIGNHSTAVDQALYFQMKKIAGEEGVCFASENTLMAKLGVGKKAFKKALKYLGDHKWIEDAGHRNIQTKGGLQAIRCYRMTDIWKQNVDHYEGGAKSAPLASGGSCKCAGGCSEGSQGVAESASNKIIQNKNQNKKEDFLNFEGGINPTTPEGDRITPSDEAHVIIAGLKKSLEKPRRGR